MWVLHSCLRLSNEHRDQFRCKCTVNSQLCGRLLFVELIIDAALRCLIQPVLLVVVAEAKIMTMTCRQEVPRANIVWCFCASIGRPVKGRRVTVVPFCLKFVDG